jgi:hypothetical protein
MKNKFNFILLSGLISLTAVLPSLANTTQISMTATALDFLVVQIERTDNKIVSPDDFQPGLDPTDPQDNEILTFGSIDARGVSAGFLSSMNNRLPASPLERVLLNPSGGVFSVSNPPPAVAGALYYIKNGYQIRTVRSPGPAGELVTDVDVYNNGDIQAFVALSETNLLTAGSIVSASSIRGRDGGISATNPPNRDNGVSLKTLLKADVDNNAPFAIDLGLYVDNLTDPGSRSTTITFTGT